MIQSIRSSARWITRLIAAPIMATSLAAADALAADAPATDPSIPAAPPASPIDSLDQAALQETFRLLRTNYIERASLTLVELNRAALVGLLARLDFGADVVPLTAAYAPPDATTHGSGVVAEQIDPAVAYLRPLRLSLDSLSAVDAALESLGGGRETTLILDLRTPGPPEEFAAAAGLLSRFLPAGQPMFSVQKPDDSSPRVFQSEGGPRWSGKLMVLVDADATNAAETVAAVLHDSLKVPLVGSATTGRTMQYEIAPISPTHGLRFASAEMRLPDGRSLFRQGLQPTFPVSATATDKAAVMARQPAQGVHQFITNPERPRANEAALVARSTPDLTFQLARAAGSPTPFDSPPLQDRPLQAALDVLIARRALTPTAGR